jgi:hypothetical protein
MFVLFAAKSIQQDPQDAQNVKIQPKWGKSVAATVACLYKSIAPSAENQHSSATIAKAAVFD